MSEQGTAQVKGLHCNARSRIGERFGRLLVVELAGSKKGRVSWRCQCDCGNTHVAMATNLVTGKTSSCGCARATLASSHRAVYHVHRSMLHRCLNSRHRAFPLYGGRGITVCERWLQFPLFLADMGPRPDGASLDRIDNERGYSPENCRWATRVEQANNRRTNRLFDINGRVQTLAQWARERRVNYQTAKTRINVCGWSVERALGL
jgi:hypothetical protein